MPRGEEFRVHFAETGGVSFAEVHGASVEDKLCGSAPTYPTRVDVREPIYVNPCSYEAVQIVLRNIGKKVGIRQYGGDRKWVVVVCDGIPYTLCQRTIRSAHYCSICHSRVNGLEESTSHKQEEHPDDVVEFLSEFDWVVLLPGLGHVEMNM